MTNAESTRRQFLGTTTAGALAATAAAARPWHHAAATTATPGPNDSIHLGLIGCGARGAEQVMPSFQKLPGVRMVAVCDVNAKRLAAVRQKAGGDRVAAYHDFRKLLDDKSVDAVIVATQAHWHALITVAACQAGKDVYVEKPLATTIDEGRAMVEAARRHNRVVQMGSQWRSCQHIIEAAEMVRSGKLGKVGLVRGWAYLDWLPSIGHKPDCEPPPGVDYDMWLGPAPKRPFNPNRFHFNFRWFWDYAGGLMTDWGVHLINMMLMGMGMEPPRSAYASGGKFVLDDDSETPDSQIAVYEFPTFTLVWEHKAGLNNGLNGRSWGVQWSGSEGTIILNDSGWEIITERKQANLDSQRKPGSGNPRPAHVRNFLDCVRSRKQPVLNLEVGHHVSTVAHLGNIAYRSGRKVVWDPVKERIVDDREADRLVGVKYRKPWSLPYSRRA